MPKITPKPFPAQNQLLDSKTLGEAVRSVRTHGGLSIEQAALMIGVAKQTLSDLEAGKPTVSLGLALKVANELGVSIFVVPKTEQDRVQRFFLDSLK